MRRFKRISRATGALLGVLTAVGLAWFVVGVIEGEGTTKTGKAGTTASVPVAVTFAPAEGLTPEGQPGGIESQKVSGTFTLPEVSVATKVYGVKASVKDSSEGACPASNFALSMGAGEVVEGSAFGLYAPIEAKPNVLATLANVATMKLAAAAPTGCENVTSSVKLVAVTNATVPAAPTGLTVTFRQPKSDSLQWNAPPSTSGSPVTSYTVEQCNIECLAVSGPMVVSGTPPALTLTYALESGGTTATYKVFASNGVGNSSLSSVSTG
jgi:hypothetical protein